MSDEGEGFGCACVFMVALGVGMMWLGLYGVTLNERDRMEEERRMKERVEKTETELKTLKDEREGSKEP